MASKKERWERIKPMVYDQVFEIFRMAAAYEMNCPTTWGRLKWLIISLLNPVEAAGYIDDFKVTCSAETNPSSEVLLGRCNLLLSWRVYEGDAYTVVKFTVGGTGARYVELKEGEMI